MNLGPRDTHQSAGNQRSCRQRVQVDRVHIRHRPRHDAAPRQGGRAGPRLLVGPRSIRTDVSRLALIGRSSATGQIGADAFPHQLLGEPRPATARFRRTSPRGTPRCPRSPPHARSRSV
jgi:hypothetical protein